MCKAILFGGTTEGRVLAEYLYENSVSSIVCVATEYGEHLLDCKPPVAVHTGRLDKEAIQALIERERPLLVIDATHPYANSVSESLHTVCGALNAPYLRIRRETSSLEGCACFSEMDALVAWLNTTDGVIFSTLGAKEAKALTGVLRYRERVFLRLLPSVESIEACAALGYPMKRLCCMQGPFSAAFNEALFRETKARILLTKESGQAGGFLEKIQAAKNCGMTVAVLTRPNDGPGVTMEEAKKLISEACL